MGILDDATEGLIAEIGDGLQLLGQIEDIQLLGMIEGIVDFTDAVDQFAVIISAGIVLVLFICSNRLLGHFGRPLATVGSSRHSLNFPSPLQFAIFTGFVLWHINCAD
jgi:Na+/proline symporter